MSIETIRQNLVNAYQQSVEEVLIALKTNEQHGLSTDEARARIEHYGKNELTAEKPFPEWKKFFFQFQNPLVILLLIATLVSAGLWLYERDSTLPYEALAIFFVVLLNAVLGYVQQSRSEQAGAALRQITAAHAVVLREGLRQSIPASEVVPGDIIFIEQGDTIPADARLIQSTALQTAEAALTGESLPTSKDTAPISETTGLGDRHNMVFSGTAATYGRGRAVVTTTGMQTQIGRIAGILKETSGETTPLQKELDRTGRMLGIIVVLIALAMITTIIFVEDVRGFSAVFDVLILGVALAVAAVPEGLPAIITAVLSLGVQRMARRNAIVRHLAAVETLGSTNVIASDKTGTLTKNEMTVRTVVTASGRVSVGGTGYNPSGEITREGGGAIDGALRYECELALKIAARVNNAVLQERTGGDWTVQGDPTEGALLVAARKAGIEDDVLDARIAEIPFSSERKLMSTIQKDAQKQNFSLVFTKGAPDVLLANCSQELVGEKMIPLTEKRRRQILDSNEELAGEALRTLGVALRSISDDSFKVEEIDERIERDLVFAGLIGMLDPPRETAKDAVTMAKIAGIRSIMITGDHPKTAVVIAGEIGIADDGRVITGAEMDEMSDDMLMNTVIQVSVYARVNPEHKLRLVKALQREEMTVAMTGDGVNDAPALKAADIGVAMGITGTDVSKEAADMILADDNFASIVEAVKEGRALFSNIRKFLRYLLSSNIGEVMTMFFGVLLADFIGLQPEKEGSVVLPLLATQILWINLVSDGAPALALGLDPAERRVMNKPPRPRGERVVTNRMWRGILFVGTIMAAGTLLVLDAGLPGGLINGSGNLRYAQTMAFTTLMLFQMFNLFNARSDEQSAFVALFKNQWLWAAIGLSLALQGAVIYLPFLQQAFSTVSLTFSDWLQCAAVASSVLWLRELSKIIVRATSKK